MTGVTLGNVRKNRCSVASVVRKVELSSTFGTVAATKNKLEMTVVGYVATYNKTARQVVRNIT